MKKTTAMFLCSLLSFSFIPSLFAYSKSGPDIATAREWCRENPEACRSAVREKVKWCRNNQGVCREKAERWCENHPGKCKARAKRWCKNHPAACDWIKENR